MIEITDQIGHIVKLNAPPKRIVSLVPSQSELLYDLGLDEEVLGVTKFCIHPKEWRKIKTVIGGTKKFHLDRIDSLKPDLIIANKEENTKEDIIHLQSKYPVYTSDVLTLQDSFEMMNAIGELTGKQKESEDLVRSIKKSFENIKNIAKKKAVYVIWNHPFMAAGRQTFIHSMLELAGYVNVIEDKSSRYPTLSIQELAALNPEEILLSSEPFPFKEKHKLELIKETGAHVSLVDGEMFSWYGSRMLKFAAYINGQKQV